MATVGDVADTIHLIKRIINAIETAQKLKDVCLEFKDYLWCISKNLEQLQGMPLSDITVETLRRVENVLVKAYHVINSSQNHNFVYLTVNGARIQKQIKEAHSTVVDYMGLIPIMQFGETFRLFTERTNIIFQKPHESAPNGTDAASNSGCLMARGVFNSQIALSNQAEFRNEDVCLRIFDFKEMKSATDDFNHDYLLGAGGFGSVYKGLVKDNSGPGTLVVAIKRFHQQLDKWVSKKDFEAEVKYLGRISHPNVIKLLGYCNKIDKRKSKGFRRKEANINFLVFEYMANGNLPDHLFSDEQVFEPLSWAQRIKIAYGSARALAFLHKLQIIHRDVKSYNILLDLDFNSKLADFGLAMDSNSLTDVGCICGTFGYLAPEYLQNGELSEKIDVYGFGVTLLEILSGQRILSFLQLESSELSLQTLSTIRQSPEDSSTNPYIDGHLQKIIFSSTSGLKNLDNLMDTRLDGKYPLDTAHLAVELALSCVDVDPNNRPSMEEVVKVLELIQTPKMPSTTSSLGRIIFDPCDPLPCDIDFLASSSMVYEPAPFDADAELSFSVPRSMMMSEPAPYDPDAELSLSLSKSMVVYEPAPFDAETELSFPKFKTSLFPISIEV